MGILSTMVGCVIGVAIYLLLSLVMPLKSLGDYSVGIMVALCLVCTAGVGAAPWFSRNA